MLVKDFLEGQMFKPVTVAPDNPLSEAARRIGEAKRGFACVCDTGGILIGVISVIDINRALGSYNEKAAATPIREVMNSEVVSCTDEETLDAVLEIMRERAIRHVPVTKDGKLVGLLNLRDLLRHHAEEAKRDIDFLTAFVFGVGYR